jgi:hypothetical protein
MKVHSLVTPLCMQAVTERWMTRNGETNTNISETLLKYSTDATNKTFTFQ